MSGTPPSPRAPYRIETERLVLRPYGPEDAEALRATTARCKEHLLPFMPWARFEPQTLEQKSELILAFRARYDSREDYVLGMFDTAGRLVGGTGLHPRLGPGAMELGYWITPENEGQGFVTEAVKALCRVAFDGLGVDLVAVRMAPENERSIRIPERLGFTREGLLRRGFRADISPPRDVLQYTLLEDEFVDVAWRADTLARVRAFDVLGHAYPLTGGARRDG